MTAAVFAVAFALVLLAGAVTTRLALSLALLTAGGVGMGFCAVTAVAT